ncbi:MAG: DUF4249 family protein, partial [Salinivirgaceae bacterium]|nr:DUF4249 family protein [Salinivirgaceae bacterium]
LFMGNGEYQGSKVTNIDHFYKMVAIAEGFPTASAETELLPETQVLSVDSVGIRTNSYGDSHVLMRIKMSYQPNLTSYYRVTAFASHEWLDDGTGILQTFRERIYLDYDDYMVGVDFYTWSEQALYFTDKIRTNQEAVAEFIIQSYFFTGGNVKEIEIYVSQLSSDYYMYKKSVVLHEESSDIPIFSQPVQVFNNIEDGLGILGTAKAYVFSIDFD